MPERRAGAGSAGATAARWALVAVAALCASPLRAENAFAAALADVAGLSYAELTASSGPERRRGHLLALGAMQKVRGVWRPDESERHDGILWQFTWRATDMMPSELLLDDVVSDLGSVAPLEPVFSCDARACGSSAQWANRIFGQRLLYGTEASQRYRVFAAEEGGKRYRVVLYASARTSDRQYLHADLLELSDDQ